MTDSSQNERRIAGPGPCVRTVPQWPIPGPAFPEMPPAEDEAGQTGYVFPTWRAALGGVQKGIEDAYESRRRMFRAAHEAGLTYREIAEATGLSHAGVAKIIGRAKTTLDSPAVT